MTNSDQEAIEKQELSKLEEEKLAQDLAFMARNARAIRNEEEKSSRKIFILHLLSVISNIFIVR